MLLCRSKEVPCLLGSRRRRDELCLTAADGYRRKAREGNDSRALLFCIRWLTVIARKDCREQKLDSGCGRIRTRGGGSLAGCGQSPGRGIAQRLLRSNAGTVARAQ